MDSIITKFLVALHGRLPALDAFAAFCAEWLPYLLVLGFCAACILLFPKDPVRPLYSAKERLYFILTSLLTLLIVRGITVPLIRFVYPVSRPFAALNFTPLVPHAAGDPSFPSGHAAVFFTLAYAVWCVNKRWGAYMFAGAALNAVARVYGGIHWPSDVLVGIILGVSTLWLTRKYATLNA